MKTPYLTKTPCRLAVLLCSLAILLTIVWTSSAAETVSAPLEKAALAGNWEDVISLAGDVEKEDAPYAVRLIKGHAYLVLNRSNESASLFFTRGTPENLASYGEWTAKLVGANPQSALAHYFNGDALARQQRWEDSLKEFDTVVQIDPKLALAYNARGVVHAVRKEIGPAKADFQKAVETSNGKLADAFCNAGYLWIQRKDGPKGAKKDFDDALAVAPSCALAAHGRGCIALVTGNAKQAEADIVFADTTGKGLYPVLCENEVRYAAHLYGKPVGDLVAELSKPGMTLTRDVSAITSDVKRTLDNYNKMPQWLQQNGGGWGPLGANRVPATVLQNPEILGQLDSTERQTLQNVNNNIAATNSSNGFASKGAMVTGALTDGLGIASAASNLVPNAKVAGFMFGLGAVIANRTNISITGSQQLNSQNSAALKSLMANSTSKSLAGGALNTQVGSSANPKPNIPLVVAPTHPPAGAVALVPLVDGKWPFAAVYSLGYGIVD